jgi:regulator of protease activity HflC (stomatin/prohibitin superfamily)
MNNLTKLTTVALVSYSLMGCSPTPVDAGTEGVVIKKPWIFGHGGVSDEPIQTGLSWTAWSTQVQLYNVKPVKRQEHFIDLTASDNVAIDFIAYITTQINRGSTPKLHENFGTEWYENNLSDVFRKVVRNEARARTSIELRTNEKSIDELQNKVLDITTAYIQKAGLPIKVTKVVIGKVVPPEEVLREAERTAAQKQRLKTQEMIQKAEVARKGAETARALADKAYIDELGVTGDQYIRLKELDIIEQKKDVSVYMGMSPVPFKQF